MSFLGAWSVLDAAMASVSLLYSRYRLEQKIAADTQNEDPQNEDPQNEDPPNDDPPNEDPPNDDPPNEDPQICNPTFSLRDVSELCCSESVRRIRIVL